MVERFSNEISIVVTNITTFDYSFAEGIREKERMIMTTVLKAVAFMRDNTYHIVRHAWNDVQEDWPFYTEQEKTMLKRRKPQNLTPPGSSDGSSGTYIPKIFYLKTR